MYEAAREGKPMEGKARQVTIYSIALRETPQLHDSITPSLSFTIHSSSGTYIRAIARDLGQALGTGGYVESLRRTKIGPFDISECVESIIPISAILSRL